METQKPANKNGHQKSNNPKKKGGCKSGAGGEAGSKEDDYDSESSKVDKKPGLQDPQDSERSDKEQEGTKKAGKRKKKSKKGGKGQESARKSDTESENAQANAEAGCASVPVEHEQSVVEDGEKKEEEKKSSTDSKSDDKVPESLINNVLKHSAPLPSSMPTVKGLCLRLLLVGFAATRLRVFHFYSITM